MIPADTSEREVRTMPAKSGKARKERVPPSPQQGQGPKAGLWEQIRKWFSGQSGAKPAKGAEPPPMRKPKGDYWKPKRDHGDIPPP